MDPVSFLGIRTRYVVLCHHDIRDSILPVPGTPGTSNNFFFMRSIYMILVLVTCNCICYGTSEIRVTPGIQFLTYWNYNIRDSLQALCNYFMCYSCEQPTPSKSRLSTSPAPHNRSTRLGSALGTVKIDFLPRESLFSLRDM